MKAKRPHLRRLFSYVLDHDYGFAPNPFYGFCTLAHCKFSTNGKRRNIVELAEKGDWIVGTGGADLSTSGGHGTVVYVMKVGEKLSLKEYFADSRFVRKKHSNARRFGDNLVQHKDESRWVLIAKEFYYFGKASVKIPARFRAGAVTLEKRGPGFKCYFSQAFIRNFEDWITGHRQGIHGQPCAISEPCNVCAAPKEERGICKQKILCADRRTNRDGDHPAESE